MSDDFTPTMQPPSLEDSGPMEFKRPSGAPRSLRGKLVIGAVLLAAVTLAAVAVFFLLGQSNSNDVADPSVAVAQSGAAPVAPSSPAPAPPEAPAEVALDEVFTFRDIFVSLVKPKAPSQTTSETSTPGSTPTQTSSNTILLQDITVENGERTVVLVWNGQTYSAQAGDAISDSPWKVLEIRTDSVVMLYGDTQVVLSIGQAVSK